MGKMIVTNISDINKIVNVIHDQWFDIDEIKFVNHRLLIKVRKERENKAKVIKNYLLWKRIKIPVEEYYLKIYKVKNYEIKDTEKVGLYDFNTIEYFKNENRLKIITGIPLKFEVVISDFKIILETTDNILDWKTKTIFSFSLR